VPVAVKVTVEPLQTLAELAVMVTVGLELLFTVKVIPDEVAVVPLKQVGKVPPTVRTALILSPLVGV
jgi:hypothetical protein